MNRRPLERLKRDLVVDRLNFDPIFREILASIRRVKKETPTPLIELNRDVLKRDIAALEASDPILGNRWELEFDAKRHSWFLQTSPAWRALEVLVEFANTGELNSLRECRICKRWFFARTNDHVCCTSRCRQKLYASSPDFRAKRAKYMRALRKLHKRKQERQKQAIQRLVSQKRKKGRS